MEPNAKASNGRTVLHSAAIGGNKAIFILLLKKGVEIDAKDMEVIQPSSSLSCMVQVKRRYRFSWILELQPTPGTRWEKHFFIWQLLL